MVVKFCLVVRVYFNFMNLLKLDFVLLLYHDGFDWKLILETEKAAPFYLTAWLNRA